jgi:lipopolysaccharide transport system permease protein
MENADRGDEDDAGPVFHLVDGRPPEGVRQSGWRRSLLFLAEPFTLGWWHRDLIAAILRRELHERFKGSMAGWVWAVVAPLLSLAVYTIMFGGTMRQPNDQVGFGPFDYALFIFGGLIAFNFFAEMAYRAPALLQEYAHFIKQTMFPAEMLPVISTLRATVYSSIGLALMAIAQLVLTGGLHWTMLLVPLWFLSFVVFLMGVTWFLSALGAHTRDVSYFMMTTVPLLMFATPVFFGTEKLDPTVRLLMYLNILTGFIEIVRDITVLGKLPAFGTALWTITLSLITFYFGYWFFRQQRGDIADVL